MSSYAKKRPAVQSREAAITAVCKWWSFTLAMVQELSEKAEMLRHEVKRKDSPLYGVIPSDNLRQLSEDFDYCESQLLVCHPVGDRQNIVQVPDPMAGV